jgi:hypothetical protein
MRRERTLGVKPSTDLQTRLPLSGPSEDSLHNCESHEAEIGAKTLGDQKQSKSKGAAAAEADPLEEVRRRVAEKLQGFTAGFPADLNSWTMLSHRLAMGGQRRESSLDSLWQRQRRADRFRAAEVRIHNSSNRKSHSSRGPDHRPAANRTTRSRKVSEARR